MNKEKLKLVRKYGSMDLDASLFKEGGPTIPPSGKVIAGNLTKRPYFGLNF
jgi:hypothetical protein